MALALADVERVGALADPGQTFRLGLPGVWRGPLLDAARALGSPVLLSANAFSVREKRNGWKEWMRFRTAGLPLLEGMDAALDSAGFVAMHRYRGYDWTVDAYMDLCAAFPWRWFAAMDMCCEEEIAGDRTTVLDRISETVGSLGACLRAARRRGIADRLLPVVQGWLPADYARCLDRMPVDFDGLSLLGVGSVCRRPLGGPEGVLAVVDRIHDELGSSPARLHLFGVKSDGLALLRGHPRVASFDSQAYGTGARVAAHVGGFSKTNVYLAAVMGEWYGRQKGALLATASAREHQAALPFGGDVVNDSPIERKVAAAREEMRALIEAGEMDACRMTDRAVWEWAFDEDDDFEPGLDLVGANGGDQG